MASRRISIGLDGDSLERLDEHSRETGESRSAAAERLIEEGLRMAQHPGIVFRDGATGRRPALADGPQVWALAAHLPGATRSTAMMPSSALLRDTAEADGATAARRCLGGHSLLPRVPGRDRRLDATTSTKKLGAGQGGVASESGEPLPPLEAAPRRDAGSVHSSLGALRERAATMWSRSRNAPTSGPSPDSRDPGGCRGRRTVVVVTENDQGLPPHGPRSGEGARRAVRPYPALIFTDDQQLARALNPVPDA